MQILRPFSETGKPPNFIFNFGVAELDLSFHHKHRLFRGILNVVNGQNDADNFYSKEIQSKIIKKKKFPSYLLCEIHV